VELAGLYSNPLKKISGFKNTISTNVLTEVGDPKPDFSDKYSIPHFREKSNSDSTEVARYKQKQKRLTEEEKAEIVKRYQAGENTNQLAAAYGCHRNTISNTLKKAGIDVTIKKIGIVFNPEEAIKLYAEGWKSKDIGKKLGVSELTIRKCLKEHGIKLRTRWDYPR